MTPEERKAIAMRLVDELEADLHGCGLLYPRCCNYHEGFDDALALLVPFRSAGGTRAFIIEAAP